MRIVQLANKGRGLKVSIYEEEGLCNENKSVNQLSIYDTRFKKEKSHQ